MEIFERSLFKLQIFHEFSVMVSQSRLRRPVRFFETLGFNLSVHVSKIIVVSVDSKVFQF